MPTEFFSLNDATPTDRIELLLLLSQSGDATEAEIDEMNDLLRRSPELRGVAAKFMHLEALMREECQVRKTAERFAESNVLTVSRPDLPSRYPSPVSMLIAASSIGLLVASILLFYLNKQAEMRRTPSISALRYVAQSTELVAVANKDLATITFESDARWEPAVKLGAILREGDLSLVSGVGRLHTSHGVVLILDARSGPVRIRLDSDKSVTVKEGTVLAKAHERALGFELRTPTTSVVDIGTEFSVSVDSQGLSEVSVLDGAVACLPAERSPRNERSMLEAGQSKRFRGPRDQLGVNFEIANQLRDLRSDVEMIEQQSDQEKLIAFDSFEYPVGQMNSMTGGNGWLGPWYRGIAPKMQPPGVIRKGQYLLPPAWLEYQSNSYGVVSLASTATRKLSKPISLSVDRDVFISFLMRKRTVGDVQEKMGAGISLFAKDDDNDSPTFEVSMDWNQRLTTKAGETQYCGGTSISNDTVYLLVIKMEIREADLDRIYAAAIDVDSAPQIIAPLTWDSVSLPADQNGQLSHIRLWCGANAIAAFDELRIGNSWQSVVEISK